ncbi:MAG: protease inhibitor I42 family protein [Phycisphaerales bacterium]|nr:protease inhibitor I42 family protein [Phycisphaerales bacterium]
MRFRLLIAALLGALAFLPGSAGCGGGPQVSGTALFNTRIVREGDPVEIRLPFDRVVGLEWTLESYDSRYLSYQGRTYAMDDDNTGTLIVRFFAKLPGETELTLRRRYAKKGSSGAMGESLHNYSINILQK